MSRFENHPYVLPGVRSCAHRTTKDPTLLTGASCKATSPVEIHVVMGRRHFLQLASSAAAAAILPSGSGHTDQRLPIIDVHLHAYPHDMAIPSSRNPITGDMVRLKDGA